MILKFMQGLPFVYYIIKRIHNFSTSLSLCCYMALSRLFRIEFLGLQGSHKTLSNLSMYPVFCVLQTYILHIYVILIQQLFNAKCRVCYEYFICISGTLNGLTCLQYTQTQSTETKATRHCKDQPQITMYVSPPLCGSAVSTSLTVITIVSLTNWIKTHMLEVN